MGKRRLDKVKNPKLARRMQVMTGDGVAKELGRHEMSD
jgi:hypothetical protein